MFTSPAFDNHERLVTILNEASGLRAIIALHSTALGPAAGGCRLWTYENDALAVDDALRLAKGMSYKNAMAGLPFGGGKAVLLGPIPDHKRQACFEAFGAGVEQLGGAYITAEDVGVTVADMETAARKTSFISGLSDAAGVGGDPSPYTARGVFMGLKAAVKPAYGQRSLEGLRVAVQGVGGVGANLCRLLAEAGATLFVADVNQEQLSRVCSETGAIAVPLADILHADVDVVAPCALGRAITADVAKTLKAKVVAGGANNQLATREAGDILFERGIAHAPDYVINAGGIIMVIAEYQGISNKDEVIAKVDAIAPRLEELFTLSADRSIPTHALADQMAQSIIASAKANRSNRKVA